MRVFALILLAVLAVTNASYAEGGKGDHSVVHEADVLDNSKMTMYSVPKDRVQYYVTKPSHPAYPFMIKSKVLGRDLDTRFKATGYGQDVDSPEAKAFLKEIEDINNDKMRKLREMK